MLDEGRSEASDASEHADLDAWARQMAAKDAARRAALPIPATNRSGAPIPVTKQAAPASKRRLAIDGEIASYRKTAQRVLDEHERNAAAPAGAPTPVCFAPLPAAPACATAAVAPWRTASFAAAAVNLAVAKRLLAQAQRRIAPRRHHDALVGPSGAAAGSSAARADIPHAALGSGVDADGASSGASVFVVCKHGALMGRANGIWQDFGGRRDGCETPYKTAFRKLHEEIGLAAGHVDVLPDQPIKVVHAGYRHAVYVAKLPEENRLHPDWDLGDEETPELDSYRTVTTSCTGASRLARS